ncbi:MAG: hypothetical protein HYY36_05005 [Gammaproteobacteria bacterium]|nr:hypothetical protein [Gammaproteobacteria bacterium]
MQKSLSYLACAVLCAGISGCSRSIQIKVDSDIPTPVLATLPVSMGVFYPEEFRHYVYTEDSPDRPDWSIDAGDSHVVVFQQILPSMFESVTEVPGVPVPEGETGVKAVIVPAVVEMQFALPQETKFDVYEAWIRYQISVLNPDGSLIARYLVDGYGKTEEAFLKSRDEGLSAAINLALRDAGAKLALGFGDVTEVRDWLAAAVKH